MRAVRWMLVGTVVTLLSACVKEPAPWDDTPNNDVWFAGGTQTVFDQGSGAYSQAFPGLTAAELAIHGTGDMAFEATFVSAPSPVNPGLGPIFNSVSCANCHIADGRGRPPVPGEQPVSTLIRISVPGSDAHGGPTPVPGFGGQLQHRSIFGTTPEALVNTNYLEEPSTFADGTTYSLRRPAITLSAAYTPLPVDLMMSTRLAPPVFGLGLLEAIPEVDVRALADPGDADGDGISGRANNVWDHLDQRYTLGRFGWKAGQPTLLQQSAGAYVEDMGITSFLFPQESSAGQPQHDGTNDEPEVSDSLLYAVAFYVRTLAVPARRAIDDPQVVRGQELFVNAGCDRCHVPEHRTGVNVAFPSVSNQRIFPYTDLLLHDMGPELADGRPEFDADGTEWRTPALWGIGLSQTVNGHQYFLHDGRARDLSEAILWHGGEAETSRERFRTMTASERAALLAFLASL